MESYPLHASPKVLAHFCVKVAFGVPHQPRGRASTGVVGGVDAPCLVCDECQEEEEECKKGGVGGQEMRVPTAKQNESGREGSHPRGMK